MLSEIKKVALLVLILIGFPQTVSAHLAGQPPFFKINGVYSNLYPVPTTSLSDFALTQDLAASNFLVNQSLDFEFDTQKLPAPPEVVNQTKFSWDFGDGTKGSGLKNTHTYTKPGSYMIFINAKYITDPSPQLIQSVLINILPDKNYKLPTAIIMINNKKVTDPVTEVLHLQFNNPLQLDGSKSQGGSAKIVSYFWDFGDENSSDQPQVSHHFDQNLTQVFSVLRVKDSNGFINDSFVEVENSPDLLQNNSISPAVSSKKDLLSSNPILKAILICVIILGVGLTGLYLKKRK